MSSLCCLARVPAALPHSAVVTRLKDAGEWVYLAEQVHCCCRFLARLGKGSISVYELPEMVLLDKKSLKLEGVQDFAWSPSQPVLCAYQTEQAGGNLPARISLISFPDKRELRQKNLFSVSGAPLPFATRTCSSAPESLHVVLLGCCLALLH